jgi:glycosyltransferase involved in cell wall biosynthesis
LKIGLNATCFNDRPSGAKQRFIGIYGELIKRMPNAQFVIYEPADCRVADWFHGAPNVSVRRTPIPSEGRIHKLLAGWGYWRSALKKENFDLFEGFNLPLIKAPTGKTLMTVHDIRGIHAGQGFLHRLIFKRTLHASLKAAHHVITVSQSMASEILNFYPSAPISVIYNGLNAHEFNQSLATELLAVREKFGLSKDFILAVGHLEKRKNYLYLIDAIAKLRDRGRHCNLVIIGNNSGEKKLIEALIKTKHLDGQVKMLEGLSDSEIRCAYQLSRLFVFPSAYEGFGIPILEAMAAQRPMVLSDIPVFREIMQDKGFYFPCHDAQIAADAIEHVLTSDAESAQLIAYGTTRVQDFSFPSLATQMESLYHSLV